MAAQFVNVYARRPGSSLQMVVPVEQFEEKLRDLAGALPHDLEWEAQYVPTADMRKNESTQ